ncbi:MAG: hypothetical protein WCP45_08685 [Verrucomicrobiota bacterium]
MEAPRVEGLNVRHLFGSGGCGDVYLAADAGGGLFALKVFDGMAIQRGLLAKMTGRLAVGGWPEGVMPVVFSDLESRPARRVTPWLADGDPDVDPGLLPRTLQHRLHEHPGEDSWPLVRALARALAAMHLRRVAHGNLKPGNVFFDDAGGILLADWTLGNMPGVGHLDFTDALLYQPPEQLLDATGYAEGKGYRWDVFAFGVLAYRVLTGRFPRCHESFGPLAPAPGTTRVEGVQADLTLWARQLTAEPNIEWPSEPGNALDTGLRGWLDNCLALDPLRRPANMLEVAAGLDAVEEHVALEEEREHLLDQRRRADRRAWRASVAAAAVTAAAVVLGFLWQTTASQLRREKHQHLTEMRELQNLTDIAEQARAAAETRAAAATRLLESERELMLARLQASRLVGDELFAWGMEKGHRLLPPLDGRVLRLQRLERYFQDFLTRTADTPALRDERLRVRMQLAELALAQGNAEVAMQRLGEALQAWDGQPMDADWHLRLATNRLVLALLRQAGAAPAAAAAFAEARKALAEVPPTEVNADRLSQLSAILDFHEAKLLAARGEEAKASEQLMRATQALNRLADQRPDSQVLRSELAACYLASATILDGLGTLGDAREVRTLAMGELKRMLKQTPDDFPLRLELAGCYGAMADAALLAADTMAAESLSKEAVKLLEKLLREQPDNREAVTRMAAQLGLGAGLMRDRGQTAEAMQAFDDAIRMLERVRASAPDAANVGYRLALLWWQKARMLGGEGKPSDEISLTSKARAVLSKLEDERQPAGPPLEQIQRSLAYLLGDLGHALQLAENKPEARAAIGDALTTWEKLRKSRPKSEEYEEGVSWCHQRLKELK